MFMAGTLTCDPVELYVDCSGTVETAGGGAAKATSAQRRGAHLWGHVFCRFDSLDLAEHAHWVKGHATLQDVEDGVTTAWARRGNQHADKFAKPGAAKHGQTKTQGEEVRAILDFQSQVARLRRLHVRLADRPPAQGL